MMKDGIRAVMGEEAERETIKRMGQRASVDKTDKPSCNCACHVLIDGCLRCNGLPCRASVAAPPPDVPIHDRDLISRSALLSAIGKSRELCVMNAEDQSKPERYRTMMEHFAEAGRQVIECIELFRCWQGLTKEESNELQELRREMEQHSLGDRPSSIAAGKLKRLIDLERLESAPSPVAATVDAETKIYADGFCARCSELAYPLTRALEKTGVPTGADNWQQTYGPNKVRALADLETCLRQLLFALEDGKPEKIKERIQQATHYIGFHAAVRRRLTALAQGREPEPEPVHPSGEAIRAAAAEIVKAWLWHTPEHDQERAKVSIAAILSKHLGSAAVGEQWLPIETAPKDGRTLLLGYMNASDKWRVVRGQWFTDEEIGEWDNADDFEAWWYETSEENDEPPNCWLINPTHWMPLPSAPAATPTSTGDKQTSPGKERPSKYPCNF